MIDAEEKQVIHTLLVTHGLVSVVEVLWDFCLDKAKAYEAERKSSYPHNFWAGYAYLLKRVINYEGVE